MKFSVLLALLLFIGLVSSTTLVMNESNLRNVGDSYVAQGSAGSNYGTATSMQVVSYTSANQRTFILWNLTLPSGINVTSAKLAIYMNTAPSAGRTYNAYNTTNAWTETGITWTNQPAAGTLQQGISTGTTNGVWLVWDVTNAVSSAILQSNQNMSIVIIDSSENSGTSYTGNFYARDGASATYRPQLNITYTPASNQPASGLVGYWRFDENTGAMTDDSSGNGNIGTLINSPAWVTGKNYQTPYALSYDGTNDYVTVGNASNLNPTTNLTISFWLRRTGTDTIANTYGIVTKGAIQYGVYFYGGSLYATCNSTGVSLGVEDTVFPVNNWVHVAITCDGTNLRYYNNGALISTTSNPTFTSGTGNLQFGFINQQYLNQSILDEVKIWNRTLSASEILNESFHYCPLNLINIFPYNESSTSQFIASNLVASNTTSTFSLLIQSLFVDGTQSYTSYYCNSTFPTGAVTLSISNSSFYSPRYYYSTLTYGGSYGLNAYLLPLTDMDYIQTTILIKNELGNTVPGAVVTIQKMIDGAYTTVAQDTVDGVGQVFFTLDKNTNYYLIATASGYTTTTLYFQPSQIQYTVTLYGGVNYNIWDNSTSGIYWNVTPGSYMLTGLQNFNFSVVDSNTSLSFWGMSIDYNGTQLYFSNQTASAGGSVNYSINTSNYPGHINMTVFFKRVNGTFFDPVYQYWGYSIIANNNSLVNAMANVGSSDLSPITKSLIALLIIVVVVGYVGSQSFTGGILLCVTMMWGFASFGFLAANIVSMLTIIGLCIIILKYFPTG